MIRTLLIEEFVKRFLKHLAFGAVGAIFCLGAKAIIFRWFKDDDALQSSFNNLVVISILFVAAVAGSSTFARTFREGPLRLLDVMPIRRFWIWLVRILTSLATAGAVNLLLFMVQPNLMADDNGGARFLPLLIGLSVLLFSVGCSISTVINTPTLVSTICSGVLSLAILFVLLVAESFLGNGGGAPPEGFFATVVTIGIFPPVCLAFSLAIFERGELDTPRRRWRNAAAGVTLLLATLVLTVEAADAGAFEMTSPWKTDGATASETGANVAAIQLKGRYSAQFRVVVLETATGKVLKTYEGRGIVGIAWTPDDALLVVTKSSTLRYLLHFGEESVRVVRVFPTEETALQKTGYRFERVSSDQRGTLLLLRDAPFLASTSHSLLLRMDGAGQTKELLKVTGRWVSTASLERAFDGSALVMNYVLWRIRDDVSEMPQTVGHFRFADVKAAQSASMWLEGNRPSAPSGGPPGKYLRDDPTFDFGDSTWLYYVQPDPITNSARLWARRKSDPGWQEVVNGIPLSGPDLKDLSAGKRGPFTQESFRAVRAGARTGIVAALLRQEPDQIHLVVYDLNSKQRYDLGDMNTIPGEGALWVAFPRPFRSLITVSRNRIQNSLPGGFYLEAGKGPPVRLTQPANPYTNVKFMEGGAHIYAAGLADTGVELFYEKPGEKPRLLLAAQSSFR